MKVAIPLAAVIVMTASILRAQTDAPELSAWLRNMNGATGYGGLPANVQKVQYSSDYVYVSTSCVPAYAIGPWGRDPNIPTNQAFVFKIPRHPATNTGTPTATGLGPIAVLVNGVAVFNAKDANSYNNGNVWHSNAVVVEGGDMDACLGHPAPGGAYHHHQNPRCLAPPDSTRHSPIVGFAFDGYPIYGPYAYAHTDGSGGIARMRSGYRARAISERTTLADGTALQPSQYGPAVSASYPIGYYVEDFEFVPGVGDLDAYNGRFAVTPEYPQGTYAYYMTIDDSGASAYPYTIGPTYNGVVAMENITQHDHVTISESVVEYAPANGVVADPATPLPLSISIAPNPLRAVSDGLVRVVVRVHAASIVNLSLVDPLGRTVMRAAPREFGSGTSEVDFDCSSLPAGVYAVILRTVQGFSVSKLAIVR